MGGVERSIEPEYPLQALSRRKMSKFSIAGAAVLGAGILGVSIFTPRLQSNPKQTSSATSLIRKITTAKHFVSDGIVY